MISLNLAVTPIW